MSTYGYIHSHTGNNDYQVKHWDIISFASNNRLGHVNFIHEVPDRLHGAKPVLSGMLSTLQREDILIVTDFSKLGGSMAEVLDTLSSLSRTGIKLYVVNIGFRLDNNADAMVVASACSLVAQIEKELSCCTDVPHTKELPKTVTPPAPTTLTRRSKLDGKEDEIKSLLSEDFSMSEIARMLEVSRPALTDFIRTRGVSI